MRHETRRRDHVICGSGFMRLSDKTLQALDTDPDYQALVERQTRLWHECIQKVAKKGEK